MENNRQVRVTIDATIVAGIPYWEKKLKIAPIQKSPHYTHRAKILFEKILWRW